MQSDNQGGAEQAPQGWEPEAYRRWAQIPADTQHLVLSHGWCPQCGQARQMDLIGGAIIADDLVLSGTCAVCGHRVARLLEGDGRPRDDRRSGAIRATNSPDAAPIIARLEALASPENVAGMARFGIRGARVLGVPVKTLRAIAREAGRSHALAEALWASGIHEARILASIVAEPKRVTLDQMERWVANLDSWDLCDQCCTNLWVRTPFARDQALVWSEREEEFVKRAGFVLMAQVAGKDKHAPAELLHDYLARAERAAHDERNFVKKAINWAIREIGQRDAALNAAAIATSQRLKESGSRTVRWVGSDALRELTSAKIAERVAGRTGK